MGRKTRREGPGKVLNNRLNEIILGFTRSSVLEDQGFKSKFKTKFMNNKNSRELWCIAGNNELAINDRSYALQELARRSQL